MNNTDFRIGYNEKRLFSTLKKRIHYVGGAILIGVGLLGLVFANNETSTFYWILFVGGVLNIGIGFMGKYLHKEQSFINIKPEKIEFKNVSQKRKSYLISDLMDVIIESNKVEFFTVDHQVGTYNFAGFTNAEKVVLNEELNKIKNRLSSDR